ncbi:MAG: hydantoinase B/oxoprolinase family protein [Euryarchaeota archaeon]|nr:hydantoinase B/oxoprolinase family protein [Euryarchaeota archaeon]
MTDPVRTEVVRRGVESACEEMGEALARSAFSPNIKERRDFSCAAFDATGRMVAHAAHIPVHLGAMPASMAAALDSRPAEAWRPGDVFALNDPYKGGTHLPDLTLIAPVFSDDAGTRLVGFVADRAHHADVGGREPGSLAPGRGDALAEGVTIPGVLFWEGGRPVAAAQEIFFANSRTPEERRGDLAAQWSALERGKRRLWELRERLGPERWDDDLAEVVAYGRRRLARAVQVLPEGEEGVHEDVLDSDGVDERPVAIRVRVRREGDRVVVDLSGSDPEVVGNLNAPLPVTRSAALYALMVVCDPTAPPNAGALEVLDLRTKKGTVVDPAWPAQVSGGNVETSQRIVDVVLGALGRLVPERVPASSQGTMNNLMVGLVDADGTRYSYYETMGGGEGATPWRDGQSGIQTHMTNTQNTPVEALERAYPLRVHATRLREGSGGLGTQRGGEGVERIIGPRSGVATVSLLGERRSRGPPGLAGGADGAPGEDAVDRGDGWTLLPAKGVVTLRPEERLRIRSPGGGGHGKTADA